MTYSLLADMVLLLHGLFVLFVVCGGIAVLRWPRLARLHLPCAVWGAVIELTGWVCPLTPLENRFRHLAGETGYADGFVQHHLEPLIYPLGLTRDIQTVLGVGVLVVNAFFYGLLWRKTYRRRQVGTPSPTGYRNSSK